MQANRNTRLKRILEGTREEEGEHEVRERMQMLSAQLIDSISNLHEVFTGPIFVAICRGFWDSMGQVNSREYINFPHSPPSTAHFDHSNRQPRYSGTDRLEISRRQERKQSMVQWIILRSWGKFQCTHMILYSLSKRNFFSRGFLL